MNDSAQLDGTLEHDFAGISVLITGASSGIGLSASRAFGARGANLVLFDTDHQSLLVLQEELNDAGYSSLVRVGDVRNSSEVDAAVQSASRVFGKLDVCVTSAGVGHACGLEELDDSGWASYIDVNLTGTFNVCRSASRQMLASGGGSIITIGSALGTRGKRGFVGYCASKGGVLMLTKALAAELAPTVRVNCVSPGITQTPMTDLQFEGVSENDVRREAKHRIPLQRFGDPIEVVNAIIWLASRESSYITGAVVAVDGGLTAV